MRWAEYVVLENLKSLIITVAVRDLLVWWDCISN